MINLTLALQINMHSIRQHAIVSAANNRSSNANCPSSAIIFNSNYALAPITILTDHLTTAELQKLDEKLSKINFIQSDSNISNLIYNITHSNDDHRPQLQQCHGRIKYIFKSKLATKSIEEIFKGFASCTDYLCGFVLLEMENRRPNRVPLNIDDIKTMQTVSNRKAIKKMDRIYCVSTPFGNRSFFGTIYRGRIANIVGQQGCLLVGSMPLVSGCEGAGIYAENE